jgi:hypothetical protein
LGFLKIGFGDHVWFKTTSGPSPESDHVLLRTPMPRPSLAHRLSYQVE